MTHENLKATDEVIASVNVVRCEIERIWEDAWRLTWDAVNNGIDEEFHVKLNSNPVLASLFFEMQHTVSVWKRAGMDVDKIPPSYSVKTTKLENLFVRVEA